MAEAAQTFRLAVALAGGGEQAEIAGRASRKVASLERLKQRFRHARLNEAAARKRIAIAHKADSLVGTDDFVFHGVTLSSASATAGNIPFPKLNSRIDAAAYSSRVRNIARKKSSPRR